MIELENITKHYSIDGKDVPVLKGINLFVGQGEFVSILAPSGSGKSALSAILGCLSIPSSGSYKMDFKDATKLTADKLSRLRNSTIGFIFQDFNLLSGLTVLENVTLPLDSEGMSDKARFLRAMECLARVGLEDRANELPVGLSDGQKQRLAIARALVNQPKFLLADEPTGALDRKTGHEVLGILQQLNTLGQTIILLTNSPTEANYSKRILQLIDGNIVEDEVVENPTIDFEGVSHADNSDQLIANLWRVAQLTPVVSAQDLPAIGKLIIRSKTREAHVAAVRAIVRWSNYNIEPLLESLFQSTDWVVRTEIVKQSNLRPQEKAIPYFIRALADENSWVRHTAIVELKKIEQGMLSTEQQDKILERLSDQDERVRSAAILIVGKWQHRDLRTLIVCAMGDTDARVRANAVEAGQASQLQISLMEEFIRLSKDTNNRVRANAARALADFHPEIARNVIRDMLNAPDPMTRSSGAWLIGTIHADSCLDSILEMLKSEYEEVVLNQVIRSLAKMTSLALPLYGQINKVLGENSLS